MFASLEVKLIVLAIVLAALLGGGWYYGHTRYDAGANDVQAKWDAAKAVQAQTALTASEAARVTEAAHNGAFAGISSDYLKATSDAYPSIADALPAAVSAGTLRLRDACPAAPASGGVPPVTAASRAADAAATAALAQRTADSIAAIRVGDAADAREHQLGAQVRALQSLLRAERGTSP